AEIVERLSTHNGRNLMVVGDDAQSIYGWRGANYDNILKFPERNPGTEMFRLEMNYRSTPQILDFTNASIHHNANQFHKTLTATRPEGSRPVVIPINDVYQEAAFVAQRILQLRDEGIALHDMAVLYRAHSHSTILQAELVRRSIPYDIRSGVRFFEQAHIKDVVAHLKVLQNPFDEVAWRRLFLTLPRIGNVTAAKLWEAIATTADPLARLVDEATRHMLPSSARPFFAKFQQDFKSLHQAAQHDEPDALVRAILDTGYVDYLRAKYDAAQSRLEDIEQLAVFAKSYRNLQALLSELVLLGELYGQDVVAGSTADTERLILSSVHQAKGLEWQVVFLLRMCEGDFPSTMALREDGGEEEERRIFYVATTRAKEELYILHPLVDLSPRGAGGLLLQPSRFLQEIPFTLYEQGEIDIPISSSSDFEQSGAQTDF
ncbi:MAG: ATP-binding domain-containing protein, partial [Candidatus Omnitrophica bacterium]|nr:ATP-binding domain-containing protein [Candidatus Omnitrophota bacterium]